MARWGTRRAARYLAKYLQKATDTAGVLDRRLRRGDLPRLSERGRLSHETTLVETASATGRTSWATGATA